MTTRYPEAIVAAQASPEVPQNDNFLALAALGTYSHWAPTDSGLTRGYSGGRWGGFTVADTDHTFGASTTTYVSAKRSDGTFDFSTSNTHYNDTTNYARIETIVTGTSTITSSSTIDDRSGPGGVHGGAPATSSFTGGTLSSALNEAPPVTIASASTVNIGAAAANTINISGTTTITAFDTIAAGALRRLIFAGILTFTHNGTSLILPTGANITTSAGDSCVMESLGSGNWRCVSYQKADGTALAGSPFTGGTLTGALNEAPTVTVASSTTPAIGAAAGNTISMTGTTTVTGFDTIAAGAIRRIVHAGAHILTYNATSLILPGAANITTVAGDESEWVSLGSGNWRCTSYSRATGLPLVTPSQAVAFQLACSDRITSLTTGSDVASFRAPYAFSISSATLPRASVDTVSSSGLPQINIKKNGTTIFSTNLTIDASEKTSVTAATPCVLSSSPTSFADDDEVTIDIVAAGTGTKGLIVTLIGTKP